MKVVTLGAIIFERDSVGQAIWHTLWISRIVSRNFSTLILVTGRFISNTRWPNCFCPRQIEPPPEIPQENFSSIWKQKGIIDPWSFFFSFRRWKKYIGILVGDKNMTPINTDTLWSRHKFQTWLVQTPGSFVRIT